MNVTKGEPEIEWEVVIDRLRADTRIGIHDHERAPQPVVIDAVLRCRAHALPERIDDCLDYDAFCRLLRAYLERQPHTDLVERLAADLLVLAFERFSMLDDASLTVYKPHACARRKASAYACIGAVPTTAACAAMPRQRDALSAFA
jgi:dihydroneopterin aldolase